MAAAAEGGGRTDKEPKPGQVNPCRELYFLGLGNLVGGDAEPDWFPLPFLAAGVDEVAEAISSPEQTAVGEGGVAPVPVPALS